MTTKPPPRMQPNRVETVVRGMRYRVVLNGKVLAGCKERKDAERLAALLGAEVTP